MQACVANLAIRQAVIEGPKMGPIRNVHELQKPKFEVLQVLLDQARQLQEYKKRYGELQPSEG